MTSPRIWLSALILLVLIAGVAAFLHVRPSGPAYSDSDPAYNKEYWAAQLSSKDPKRVYEDFKKTNANAPFARQHFSAHVMGDLIYEKLGAAGIAVCDATFSFGCYHGFFARAIAEGGEARIKELDTACVEAFGSLGSGCQHGIGHGILEYVGYQHVKEALALCGQTTEAAPLLGCASGVFMEYDAPLTGSSTALTPTPRDFNTANMYDPCPTVPAKYQDTCYYQLGQFIAPGLTQDLATLQKVCGGLTGEARANCFEGAGEGLTYAAQYALSSVLTQCASFGAGSADELSCRAGVSWAFYADPAHRADSASACAYDDASKQAKCATMADLTGGKQGN